MKEIKERAKEILETTTEQSFRYSNHEIYYKGIPKVVSITTKMLDGTPTVVNADTIRENCIVITDPSIEIRHDEHGINQYTIISDKKVWITVYDAPSNDTRIKTKIALEELIKNYYKNSNIYKILEEKDLSL